MRAPAPAIAIAFAFIACAHGGETEVRGPDKRLVIQQPFPEQARLEALAKKPAPASQPPARVVGIDAWTLQGSAPTSTGSTRAQDPDATTLAQIAGSPNVVTDEMGCYARELAAFLMKHGAQPTEDFSVWLGARCGVGHSHPQLLFHRKGASAGVKLDAAKDRDMLRGALAGIPGPIDLGIGRVDDGTNAVLAIAAVRRRAALDPVPMTTTDNRVVVSGESTVPIGWVLGYATLGDDRVSTCDPTPSQRSGPKAFALACTIDPHDPGAVIEVAIAPQGALLGEAVASVWVSPDGSLPTQWAARRIAVPVGGDDRGALAWLTAINAIRERAKLPAWTHQPAQSELIGGLLPHMVGPEVAPKLRDEIALGMLAGWKVDGTIRDGDMRLTIVTRDVPLDRAVGAAMSSPSFRAGVLANDTATAALAVHDISVANLSQIAIVGYSLFGDRDYTAEEERFLDMLDADRMSRGLPPVERVGGPQDRKLLDAAAARVRSGESGPSEELDGLLDHFSQATGQTMRGGLYTTLTLDGYRPDFDGPLATANKVVAMTKIADWRPAGSAWGQHVIYIVYAVPGEQATQ